MSKIKVGVVGTGFIGPAHIEALRRLPNIEVVALCEANAELANSKAAQLGIDRACMFDELLAMKDIVAVHICTPNFLHYPQAKAALQAGKHVFVKSPWRKTCTKQKSL
jgi:Predicted dehydrogenases and related proteins